MDFNTFFSSLKSEIVEEVKKAVLENVPMCKENPNKLLTSKELAEELNIAPNTLYNRLSQKPEQLPPYITICNSKRWRLSDVWKWEDAQREN